MRERTQALYGARSQLLGSATLSPQSLALFAPVGIFVIMSGFSGGFWTVIRNPQCWAVALLSQLVATLIAFLGGILIDNSRSQRPRLWRVTVILLAGAARGLIVVWLVTQFGLATNVTQVAAVRVPSSAWTTLLWLTIFGFMLQGSRDYKVMYAQLLDEAVQLSRQTRSQQVTAVGLLQWAQLREKIQRDADLARRHLDAGSELTDQKLEKAAQALNESIEQLVDDDRDIQKATVESPSNTLTWFAPLSDAFRQWSVPLFIVIPAVFGMIGIGAITRGSIATAIFFTTVYTLVLWAELLITRSLVNHFPTHARVIFRVVILTMPVVLFMVGPLTKFLYPDALGDPTGLIFSVLLGPVLVVTITTMYHSALNRRFVLDALRIRIDDELITHLVDQEVAREVAEDLEFFVNDDIKGELRELSRELTIAAESHDAGVIKAAGELATARLSSMKFNSPWVEGTLGFDYIGEVVKAWSSLAEISVELPPKETFTPRMWNDAALIVERVTTEAVRHGRAPSIFIRGEEFQGDFILKFIAEPKVVGNTRVDAELRSWLSQIVPGQWLLSIEQGESELLVRIAP